MRHIGCVLVCTTFILVTATLAPGADRRGDAGGIDGAVIDLGGQGAPLLDASGGGIALPGVGSAQAGAGAQAWVAGNAVYEDLVATVPLTALGNVVRDAIAGKGARFDGAINFGSADGSPVLRRTLRNAVVSAVRLPRFDAQSKELATLQLTITPESIQDEFGKGGLPKAGEKPSRLTASMFAVSLDGTPLKSVMSVSPIEYRAVLFASSGSGSGGGGGGAGRAGKGGGVSNFTITLPISEAATHQKWMDDARSGKIARRNMRIEVLGPDGKPGGFTVDLAGVSIVGMRHQISLKAEGRDVTEIELSAEQLSVSSGGGEKAAAAAEAPAEKPAEPAPAAEPVAAPVRRPRGQ